MYLFNDVHYYLSSSLSSQRQAELAHVLDNNGGAQVESIVSPKLTHLITNTNRFEGWQDVAGREEASELAVVTDKWVDRSMMLGKLQSAAYYSADPAMIFSGVVACATELPTVDLEVLSAGIAALGGQWRTGLTKDVTHLFAISPSSPKYTTALHFQEHTRVKVLLPHWFDDAVRLGLGGLDTTPYEWPDPILLRGPGPVDKDDKGETAKKVATRKLDAEKRVLYKTASLWTPKSPLPPVVLPSSSSSESHQQEVPVKDVWQGRRILLGSSLELMGGRKEAVEVGIKRAGGLIVSGNGKEVDLVEECDVFVTRFRSGKAYVKAVRLNKVIGTLPWVFHVQSTGIMSPPMDQLLWYPIPKRVIEGFHLHEITVTNYTGESREYLKKLITAMGATFTPSMSGKNTVLIAAYKSGTKTTKADSWSIPVVNHTWLEDCFIKWRNLTFALEKYISFPEGVDFSTHLGERGVGRAAEEVTEEELEAMEAEDDAEIGELVEENGAKEDEEAGVAPMGTENSARDAREVQEFIALDGDRDVVMADHETNHDAEPDVANGMDVDQEDEEEVVVVAKPEASSQLKSIASRLREKEDAGSAAKTRVKKGKPKNDRSPTPDTPNLKRKSGQPEVTPAKRIAKKQRAPSTSSDEVEVVNIMRTAEKAKPNGKRKLVRRAGERYDSWITGDDDDGEAQRTSPRKKITITNGEEEKVVDSKTKARATLRRRPDSDEDSPPVAVKGKARKTPKKVTSDNDDDMIEIPKPKPRKPTRGAVSDDEEDISVKVQARKKGNKVSTDDDESEDVVVAKPKIKSKKRASSDEEEEVITSTKTKSKGRVRLNETDEDDEPSISRSRKPPKAVSSTKAKGKTKAPVVSDDEEEEEEDVSELEVIMQSKSKSKAKGKRIEKGKEALQERPQARPITPKDKIKSTELQPETGTEDEDEDEDEPPPTSKKRTTAASSSKGKSKSVAEPTTRTPQRVLSVLVPPMTLVQLKQSPDKASNKSDVKMATPSTRLERTESIRAVAGERGKASAPRLSAVTATAPGSKSKPRAIDVESSMPPLVVEDITLSGRSRRTAATKATQKLREEIMPDVMNYQNEMRNANKARRSMGAESTGSIYGGRKKRVSESAMSENEDVDHGRDKKRRKVALSRNGASPESDGEESVKNSMVTGKGKEKKMEADESEESDVSKPTKKTNTKGKSAGKAQGDDTSMGSKASNTVKLMTTQVSLSPDVSKALAKLGVKVTTRPAECTHLLAPSLVRTEKFLCALAVAPFILTSKWATDSAAAKTLLDEKDYILHDEANEKKYNFVLADAIARAKKSGGGLFAKKTFYVTPKVPIGIQLLQSVVNACGGQVTTQAPTPRIINSSPDRHVISCPADSSIWRPIAREHPIYTHELILTGALKQEVDWDSDTFKVPT